MIFTGAHRAPTAHPGAANQSLVSDCAHGMSNFYKISDFERDDPHT